MSYSNDNRKRSFSRQENYRTDQFGRYVETEKFDWKLKNRKLSEMGVDSQKSHSEEASRKIEFQEEIEKLSRRRKEREAERLWREKERTRSNRDNTSSSNASVFEKNEDVFQLRQIKVRSNSRYKEGRCQGIDVFYIVYAGYIRLNDDTNSRESIEKAYPLDLEYPKDIPSPLDLLKELNRKKDIDTLLSDVEVFLAVESVQKASSFVLKKDAISPKDYWSSLKFVLVQQKETLEKEQQSLNKKSISPDEVVKDEIDSILHGKSLAELNELEDGIQQTLKVESGIDEDYWRSLLQKLVVYKAQSQIIAVFDKVIKDNREVKSKEVSNDKYIAHISKPPSLWDQFCKSIKPADTVEDEPSICEEMFLLREEENGFAENEEAFNDVINLSDQSEAIQQALQKWDPEDKFRPRKPKYFNRVKTGYEWNKYNQTHYDIDNPPPKIVQGYKFNVFYPDLIDRSVAPKYIIEKTDSPDFVIIRFHAGPPYLDIAFKIVNKEWECGHKKGFKSMFSNGVLYLWFNFKRLKYRR